MMENIEGKRIDFNYKWNHGDLFILMENAGKAVSEYITEKYGKNRNILVISGSGNNGGDGIITAHNLDSDNNLKLIVMTRSDGSVSSLSRRAMEKFGNDRIIKNPNTGDIRKMISESDIIVDAIFGTGIRDPVKEPYSSIIEEINLSRAEVISIDVPSGLGTSHSVLPDATVTFTDVKEGMNEKNSGSINVRNIGIDEREINYAGPGDMVYFPKIEKNGHKGQNGKVLIMAGWKFTGAGCMTARAAENALPDLITMLVPKASSTIFSIKLEDQIVGVFNSLNMKNELEKCNAVLTGPGMGISEDSVKVVLAVCKSGKKAVFDADAIHIMAEHRDLINQNMLFTPHSHEFEVLTGTEANRENAEKFSVKYGCTILLKGPADIITNGKKTVISEGGSPRMAMGGTGDILAGLCTGLMARNMDPFHAAVLGSFINKKNGERLEKERSYWFNTYDLLGSMGRTFREYYDFIISNE
ncbi:NAD(P)H-hydrate dehydratase [Cuniculiplasma divulgatum]|jgi:hydroxyethylthiazole kinase-like uncharacterized protein yjeF|uniref:Bifunctional NAD(P)H-hydrate repair enzyme n=1 Tax=Cuniculiplasma divulgatum TaxID=1673428 RepID=A0A1R4A9N5_9ARCH|nr:NAD(P)H-hydrate dehydratase [Cuniculiplasma divulgatum]MCI2412070.1 NAD(P)H-hydrate dehydratase [Cuniculiplasma sp.]SJK85669.1 predicted sugar kinase [Cuniculiplasma divulgatum]